jgi:hypothetical protein
MVKTMSRTVWSLTPVPAWQTRPGNGVAAPTTGLAPQVAVQPRASSPRDDDATAGAIVNATAQMATSKLNGPT